MQKKLKAETRTPYVGPKINVHVVQQLMTHCPYCNEGLKNKIITLNQGNKKNPDSRICLACNKTFITFKCYKSRKAFFSVVNEDDLQVFRDDYKDRKREQRELRTAKRDDEIRIRNEAIDALERVIRRASTINEQEWKREWKAVKLLLDTVSLSTLNSFIAVFLIKKGDDKISWHFITNDGRKNNHIAANVWIAGPDGFYSRSILEAEVSGKKEFKIADVTSKILSVGVFKREAYDNMIRHAIHKSDLPDKAEPVKDVRVYFRLNNKCVQEGHRITSVTAKTTNMKTGIPAEVNVFYCCDCKRYFMNYEALQGYIAKGIYPMFSFTLMEVDASKLKSISELRLYGYHVQEGILKKEERQQLLAWIIDAGLINKADIIKDLQFKIQYNGKKTGNESAKKKWQDDLQFVSHYVKGNSIRIQAKFSR